MAPIYVTGHRHPDTDSVASAVGYAELKRRLDPANDYVPVPARRAQRPDDVGTRARRGPVPEFLPHVLLRVGDVMRTDFPVASDDEPVREVGPTMAREGWTSCRSSTATGRSRG